MHKIRANRTAVVLPRFVRNFSSEIEVRRIERLQKTQGIEICLQITPTAKRFECPFAIRAVCSFFRRLCRFCAALRFERCPVCHGASLPILNFAIERRTPLPNLPERSRYYSKHPLDVCRVTWTR